MNLLHSSKRMLTSGSGSDMKYLEEAHYVFGTEIKRDRSKRVLGLSQKNHINRITKGST